MRHNGSTMEATSTGLRGWTARAPRTIVGLLLAGAVLVAGGPAQAFAEQSPCGPQEDGRGPLGLPIQSFADEQMRQDLCAKGPVGCVAVGLYARVAPNSALPGGATVQLARSTAQALAYGGTAWSHGDAAVAKADVPPTLGAGVVESSCDAGSLDGWANHATGSARTARFSIDLSAYAIPVTLSGTLLDEHGAATTGGGGGNSATVAELSGSVFGNPIGPIGSAAAPNTMIPLGAASLFLNEQFVDGPPHCPIFSGDALRLVVTDPTTGATIATVILSWVSTTACLPVGPM